MKPERAAAVDTLARPKKTKTTLGKQHNEAMNADPPMSFHNERTSLVPVSLFMGKNLRVIFEALF